jgi:Family of unknown function (DUF6270)
LWATHFIGADGTRRPFPNMAEIVQVNEVLAAYYARIKAAGVATSIAVPEDMRVADENHRWTLEPFHYADIYYRAFMAALDGLTLPAEALAG